MIVYTKYNDARKPIFQLITKIWDEKGKLFVTKEAAFGEGQEFLLSLLDKYTWLSNHNLPFTVTKPTLINEKIKTEFLDSFTLDDEIKKAVALKSSDDLEIAFTKYYELINKIPYKLKPLSSDFMKIFGETKGKFMLAEVGCLDITPENLTISSKGNGYVHFDYEWTFDFPIPLILIYVRAFINTYKKFQDYKIYEILPFEKLMDRFEISKEDLTQVIKWENRFQLYVHEVEPELVTTAEELLSIFKKETFVDSVTKIDQLLIEANIKNEELQKRINEISIDKSSLEESMSLITNSRVWRARNVLAFFLGKKRIK